jgi:hypothetical protein
VLGEFQTIALDPAKKTGVIDGPALLAQRPLQLPVTQSKDQLPAHTQENQVALVTAPFKIILPRLGHDRSA